MNKEIKIGIFVFSITVNNEGIVTASNYRRMDCKNVWPVEAYEASHIQQELFDGKYQNLVNPTECDKMLAVKEQSEILSNFVDWLNEKQIILCKYDETDKTDELFPIHNGYEKLFAEFFDIDLNKVGKEKQQILKDIRAKQE